MGSCERTNLPKEQSMRYGKIAAKVFAVLAVTVSLQILLHPT
jgi:hypothetical protein